MDYTIERLRTSDQRLFRLFFRDTPNSYRARRLFLHREGVGVRIISFKCNYRQLQGEETSRASSAMQGYASGTVQQTYRHAREWVLVYTCREYFYLDRTYLNERGLISHYLVLGVASGLLVRRDLFVLFNRNRDDSVNFDRLSDHFYLSSHDDVLNQVSLRRDLPFAGYYSFVRAWLGSGAQGLKTCLGVLHSSSHHQVKYYLITHYQVSDGSDGFVVPWLRATLVIPTDNWWECPCYGRYGLPWLNGDDSRRLFVRVRCCVSSVLFLF